MDNLKGQTAAFASFSYFKGYSSRAFERLVLIGAALQTKKVRPMKFLHTAHFCRITPTHLKRAGLRPDGDLRHGALLFLSTYNGDGDVYFRAFSDQVAGAMNWVWGRCRGWQRASPYPFLRSFIRTDHRDTQMFHSGYPDTVRRIRSSLRLCRELDELHAVALAPDVDDATFEREFRQLAMRHWVNS